MTYAFRVILDAEECSEELAERVMRAGDGLPGSSEGVVCAVYSREADSLVDAVRGVLTELEAARVRVKSVEFAPAVFA